MIIITDKSKKNFSSIGNIKSFEKISRGIAFEFENGKGKVLIYSPKLIRITLTHNKDFDLDHSYAVIKNLDDWSEKSYNINDTQEIILITTDDLIVEIYKSPFKVIFKEKKDGKIICEDNANGLGFCFHHKNSAVRAYKKIRNQDHYFGFGEKTGPLDKKGEYLIMSGKGMPYKGNAEPLYQNHPYFISISEGKAYGIFLDNISKTIFDMGKTESDEYYFEAAKGDLNYYFIYGSTINEILELYTELTGRIEMPPKWSIAYHQCRYSYKNEKEIKKITSKFREAKIPCDNIWFDIHYMDGYRCFTFNHKRFPDPKRLMEELKNDGFKPFVIVDPGIKIDEDYPIFKELVENKYYAPRKDGSPALGLVWPGLTYFPDFTKEEVREWWADKHKYYFDLGVMAIWNDMNEPAFSINPVISKMKRLHHEDMYLENQGRNTIIEDCKNIYGLCEAHATWMAFKKHQPNQRPFVLTRSGYSGVQRYAAIWTGDNWTNWKNIGMAIRMCVNLNLSAQVFVGSDIGGFMGILKYILRDKKQFIRWIQSGAFHPFFRVHTAIGSKSQDPFSYGKKVQEISKKYIELRYELFPYWYNLFYNAYKRGEPILRPLFYDTPEDETCYDKAYENQFLVGKDILVIPIVKRSIKNKLIYLPEGKWVNYWTLEELEGKKEHVISITLNDIPIFIRKGAIIPTQPVIEYIGQKPIDTLILKIYQGDNGTSTTISVYEDDGETMEYAEKESFCTLDITCEFNDNGGKLIISELKGKFKPSWKTIKYIIYGKNTKINESTINFTGSKMETTF